MKHKYKLASAGNVEPPIYYLLLEKGYEVSIQGDYWIAENDNHLFMAANVIELAGLIFLTNAKGQDWQVDDDKIDNFIEKFCT